MEKEITKLIAKVRDLYGRYGIRSVTMDDVARELGISKKTIYQYVSDKEDLVRKVLFSSIYELTAKIDAIHDNEKANAIEISFETQKAINEHMKHYNTNVEFDLRKYYPNVLHEFMDYQRTEMFRSVMSNMERGIKEGYFRKDLNSEIIGKLIVSQSELHNEKFIVDLQNKYLRTEIFAELFVYHLRGICSEKGIQLLEAKMKESNLNNNK